VKPAPFEYRAPTTLEEAIAVMAQFGDEAKALAGGQSLVPLLNMRLARFEILVDLNRIDELKSVTVDGTGITIGAMVRQCQVEETADIAAAAPLLARATPLIGHFQIRNRGTVGGSIAHADPAAEYPAVAVALEAVMELTGPDGSRQVPASDFFTGTWTTAARACDVLTSVTFPAWGRAGFAVEEVGRRHGDYAIAGACVGIRLDSEGRVDKAAIAMFGVGSTPIRATGTERSLVGYAPSELDVIAIAQAAVSDLDPPEDLNASAGLRRRVAATTVRRAVESAVKEVVSE
jgi:carbon-monoxide dehydrogenase medium subunit